MFKPYKQGMKPARLVYSDVLPPQEYVRILEGSLALEYAEAERVLTDHPGNDDEYISKSMSIIDTRRSEILSKITDEKDKSKAGIFLNAARDYVRTRFHQFIRETREKIVEARAKVKRELFIAQKTASAPTEVRPVLASILRGLFGDEINEIAWDVLYQHHCGWDATAIKTLSLKKLSEKFPIPGTWEEKLTENPLISNRINALRLRAADIFNKRDPEFAEQYENYLLYSYHRLIEQNPELTEDEFEQQILSPEKYHRKSFLGIPERTSGPRAKYDVGMDGSGFVRDILGIDMEQFRQNPRQHGNLSDEELQNLLLMQWETGNIPDFLRHPKKISIPTRNGGTISVYAMPDYFAVGSNHDYVRFPMWPAMAQAIARQYDLSLPTRTVVDAIWNEAGRTGAQLPASSLATTSFIRSEEDEPYLNSPGFVLQRDREINDLMASRGIRPGTLIAGPKKELVVSNGAARNDRQIHFYGLYDANGKPIQRGPAHGPLGYRHDEYALGIRFLSQMVTVTDMNGNKKVISMNEALMDKDLSKDLNKVGWTTNNETYLSISEGPFDPRKAYDPAAYDSSATRNIHFPG